MAEAMTRDGTGNQRSSPWATSASIFAGSMMFMAGILQCVQGLVALVNGTDFLIRIPNYLFQFDASTWGWTHLTLGIGLAAAGAFVFTGNPAARGVGIFLAGLSAVVNFLWLPYYPIWSLVVIPLDVVVIWGLASSNLGDD
jgi:hypothetical protein